MKKKNAVIWLCLFAALFMLPQLVYPLVKPYLDSTNTENRTLAEKPSLTPDSFESFPADYEEYYNDTMPYRNQLIRLNNTLQYFLFRQQDINGVAIGRDGWLFYCSEEAGNPVNQSLGCWHFSEEELETMAESMQQTKDVLAERGIEFVLFIAPNKETIYMEKLPSYYEQEDEYTATDQLVDYLRAYTDVTVVYPKEELLEFKELHADMPLYLKLDSHWNNLGAYIGARSLARALGIEMPAAESLGLKKIEKTSGDLAMVMNAAVTDVDTDYELSGITELTTEKLKDDDQSGMVFLTRGADKRNIFVARDSYSIALAPILASQFENSTFVHHTLFSQDKIFASDADIYVLEIVERNEYQLSMYSVSP